MILLVRTATVIVSLLLLGAQTVSDGSPFVYADLGFRYSPPRNLCDATASDERDVQQRAASLHTTKVLNVRLSLQSLTEDTSPDWERIGIETYPRNKLAGLSDHDAILKVARWVAHTGTEVGEPRQTEVGNFRFTVLAFELREGELVRHADVYTTILKEQVVSFSFSANSKGVLSRIETSMNSIEALTPR